MKKNNKKTSFLSLVLLAAFTLSITTLFNAHTLAAIDKSSCQITAENGEDGTYSKKQQQTIAKRITVRVRGDNNSGSGTILARKGNSYLVVTNYHVIRGTSNIKLTTVDGKTHQAKIVPNLNFEKPDPALLFPDPNFEKSDLALLQFQTNQKYCIQQITNTIPYPETEITAAGYSSAKGKIVSSTGTVEKIPFKPLKEGYQIGYSSDIDQGMSGGAIINSRGEIIGINGISKYPMLNTGYVYPDGS
ncbi:serine protease, partial [Anabaena sp. UHCC 0253]|uniref:S1 family peptidase n=1 Tax=Anabaena sp. UHCC 0253 TaxID=2590019 RepID=UPI001448435A